MPVFIINEIDDKILVAITSLSKAIVKRISRIFEAILHEEGEGAPWGITHYEGAPSGSSLGVERMSHSLGDERPLTDLLSILFLFIYSQFAPTSSRRPGQEFPPAPIYAIVYFKSYMKRYILWNTCVWFNKQVGIDPSLKWIEARNLHDKNSFNTSENFNFYCFVLLSSYHLTMNISPYILWYFKHAVPHRTNFWKYVIDFKWTQAFCLDLSNKIFI